MLKPAILALIRQIDIAAAIAWRMRRSERAWIAPASARCSTILSMVQLMMV